MLERSIGTFLVVLVVACSGGSEQTRTPDPAESRLIEEEAKPTTEESSVRFSPAPSLEPPGPWFPADRHPDCDCHDADCWKVGDVCAVPCDDAMKAREAIRRLGEDTCLRSDETSCDELPACRAAGMCTPAETDDGAGCTLGEGDCRQTERCEWFGECEERPWGCAAVYDRDCAASRMCRREGKCKMLRQRCVSKEDLPGYCDDGEEWIDGKCRHREGHDCADECRESGKCRPYVTSVDRSGWETSKPYVVCIESEEFCSSWDGCKRDGRCVAREKQVREIADCDTAFKPCVDVRFGGCIANDAACEQSRDCELHGRCAAVPYGFGCQPADADDCRQSEGCKKYGACGIEMLSSYQQCAPRNEEHCKNSTICAEDGRCVYSSGACRKP